MSKSRSNVQDSKLEKQDVLQAVVFIDDFSTNLTPMQHVVPSMLTLVANAHLFDYLIESLIRSGIQELLIYCSSHIDTFKSYISSKNYEDITISLVVSDGCRSVGDALRDLDTKGCVRGDFILIRGDAFINANLTNMLNKHKGKREKDNASVMSIILRDIGSGKNTMIKNEMCLFAADKLTERVLFYKKSIQKGEKIKYDIKWFLEHEQVSIINSCIDTHVYICSSTLLPLFSDYFDFQTMEDFITGVLMDDEILNPTIYWQSLDDEEYALPISSWPMYHTLNRDILQRQCYPLTPDTLNPNTGIISTSQNIYKHASATLAKGCMLQKDTIIGSNTLLGKNTSVNRSIISNNCKIGDNVRIENSYIWNDIVIEDNCIIKNSVLFSNSKLDLDSQLDVCIVMPDVKVPSQSNYINSILEINNRELIVKNACRNSAEFDEMLYFSKVSQDDDSDESVTSDLSNDTSSRRESPIPDDTHMFLSEVIDSLLLDYQEKLNCENLILEINSLRYAYNVGLSEFTLNVVKAILLLPSHYLNEIKSINNPPDYPKILKMMLNYFHTILLHYVKTDDAQYDCLKAIEEVTRTTPQLMNLLQNLFNHFYQKDILSELNILNWFYIHRNPADEDKVHIDSIRKILKPFINWLQEAEETTSSSDDEHK